MVCGLNPLWLPAKSLASEWPAFPKFPPSVHHADRRYDSNSRLSQPCCVSNADCKTSRRWLPPCQKLRGLKRASKQYLALSSLRTTDQPLYFIISRIWRMWLVTHYTSFVIRDIAWVALNGVMLTRTPLLCIATQLLVPIVVVARLLGLRVRIPPGHGCLSLTLVVCC